MLRLRYFGSVCIRHSSVSHSTPFNLSPDPSFLYRSAQHEEALASLIYGVQSRKGFIVLTGEVGTGKTTMLECLRDHLTAHHTPFAFLFNSRLTPDQFFEMIAYDFDLPCTRNSKTEVLFALNTMLIQRANQNQTTVLIVDEAQNLDWDVLEEIRLLGNLGDPAREDDADHSFRPAGTGSQTGRTGVSPVETADRAALPSPAFHRARNDPIYRFPPLARAGMKEQTVFTPDVLVELHRRTQGIPRLINSVCDNLMLTSFAMESKQADLAMLEEVSRDLHLEWPGGNRIWAGVETSA